MLKNIPQIIAPDLMKILMEMGHSDLLIIADANYPAAAHAKRFIRADGIQIPELLDAIMYYFPLDHFVEYPAMLMKPLDTEPTPEIWTEYEDIIRKYDEEKAFKGFDYIDRLHFYEESEKAYVIVQTATTARYANIVLQKGVI